MGIGEQKAKVAIVNPRGEVLVLTRSMEELTRKGKPDFPGGKHDPGENDPISVLHREVGDEELPGTKLANIALIYEHRKTKAGVLIVSRFFAATAEFPPEGIERSFEHSDDYWVDPEYFPELDIPEKYKTAVRLGAPVFEELVELQRGAQQGYMELAA